jgi:hypothetical protein
MHRERRIQLSRNPTPCPYFLASLGFVASTSPQNRRALVVYPIVLFYFVLAWLVLNDNPNSPGHGASKVTTTTTTTTLAASTAAAATTAAQRAAVTVAASTTAQ